MTGKYKTDKTENDYRHVDLLGVALSTQTKTASSKTPSKEYNCVENGLAGGESTLKTKQLLSIYSEELGHEEGRRGGRGRRKSVSSFRSSSSCHDKPRHPSGWP